MGMSAFGSRFLEVAKTETRSMTVRGQANLPDGDYGFLELYCDEVDCDCRRVMIQVVSRTTGPKVWATINFGWESADFYARWMRDEELAKEVSGASLDPLNPQSEYAHVLLDAFVNLVADEAYIERLKRHYTLFKSSLKSGSNAGSPRRRPVLKARRRFF
jgi:hypothetical protein